MQTNTILTNLDAFLRTPAGAYAATVGCAALAVLLWFALQPVLDWIARRCAWCRRLGEAPRPKPRAISLAGAREHSAARPEEASYSFVAFSQPAVKGWTHDHRATVVPIAQGRRS